MMGFFFLVILITSHLSGLNEINHSHSHFCRFERSDGRVWQSVWSEMVRYMMVSPANTYVAVYGVWHVIYTYKE